MRAKLVVLVVMGGLIGGVVWFVGQFGGQEPRNEEWKKQMALLPSVRLSVAVSDAPSLAPSPESNAVPSVTPRPTVKAEMSDKVRLNSATVEELDRLPGIGPAKAALIVQYRTEHGKFQATEELQLVKGIGEKTFEKLAPMLVLD